MDEDSRADGRISDFAAAYAAKRWPIFPLRPRGKVPMTPSGVKDATSDPEQIKSWWTRWPEANIALACGSRSGVLVVDVDDVEAWDRMPPLSPSLAVRTDRGLHVYYRYFEGARNSAGKIARGVDTRGEGGYVLLPPSVHPSGHVYDWTWRDRVAYAPTWLQDRLLEREPVLTGRSGLPREISPRGVIEWVGRREIGQRNEGLFWAACVLCQDGDDRFLPELAMTAVHIGLPPAEVDRTIASAKRKVLEAAA